ncbi:hypothetical protein [Candidatus Frankia alpina]|uniref:hypothetical protein n=1 Tax=Candidatus Frankia alpina TaxID=2699483 RepID=UPI0013D6DBD0|nr:hypothetical protein [Candidatus Frankia alpina]
MARRPTCPVTTASSVASVFGVGGAGLATPSAITYDGVRAAPDTVMGAPAAIRPPSTADPDASPAGQYITPPAIPVTVSNTTLAPHRSTARSCTPLV